MADKIVKAESDGVKVKYTTESGRELHFDLNNGEDKTRYQQLVASMGVASIQFAEELVGFNLPQGI